MQIATWLRFCRVSIARKSIVPVATIANDLSAKSSRNSKNLKEFEVAADYSHLLRSDNEAYDQYR